MLALRGGYRMVSVRRGWCCPVTASDGSSWLHQTYHRAQVSPAARMAMPRVCARRSRKHCTGEEGTKREAAEGMQRPDEKEEEE